MSGWRSTFLSAAAFIAAAAAAVAPGGPKEGALWIVWAIFLTGAMICGAIEERGER